MLKELWSHKLKKSSKLAFIKHLLRQNKTATALVNDQINETQEDNEENEDVAFYAMDEHCRLLSKEKNTEHTESLFYLTRIIEYLKRNVKPKEDLSSSSHNRLLRRSSRVKRHLYRCQCCQNLDENGEYENHENKQLEEFIQKYLNFDQKQGSTRQSQTLPIISNELAQIAVISLVTKNDLKMDFDLPQSLLSSIENQLCSTLIEPTSPTSNPSSFFQNLAATTMATLREQNPSSFLDTILDANDGGDDLLAETLPSAQDFDFLQNDFDFGISNETIADFDQFMEHLQLQDPEQEHQQQQESESDQYFIETMVNEPIFGHFKVELCIRV
ncbi:unnamed protein product [Didymodactylos carnosus]|nr:unnamed protein product [Didymodactylos carnosus]CAF4051405.1 unnamed protein product [Didymodactylos carnosus]